METDVQPNTAVKHPDFFQREIAAFDSKMVQIMADLLGSVPFIYFCIILDSLGFVALVQQTAQALHSHSGVLTLVSLWAAFIAQTVIQLVALPVLQNYQNRQSAQAEAKALADHLALTHIANAVDEVLVTIKK